MDERDDLERAAALADFLQLVHIDRGAGGVLPVAHYVERFPGHETAVAAEYEALEARRPDESVLQALEAHGYRIVAELGRGAQGAVYLADELELGRRVAVKVLALPFGFPVPERLARLQREAALLARIDHPGVSAIHHARLDAQPPFVVMRYVRGATLAHLIAGARVANVPDFRLPPRDARELARVLELFEAACAALAAAHAAGVVHRDVKPSNVLVDADGRPVLVDFGIARALGDDERGLTRTGEAFGTPAYMPPEQITDPGAELDARTDVYSLGVTLFECLTGSRPFDGPSEQRLEQAILVEPVPRASALNGVVPRDLDVVLATAMEKDRARRYSGAAELAAELGRVRERRPIAARPNGRALRLSRWCQRNPATAAALFVMGLAALALALATLLLLEERARTRAALRASESRNLASQAVKDLALDPLLALGEALEAHAMSPGLHSRDALYATIGVQRVERIYPHRAVSSADLVSPALAPDASTWLAGLVGGEVVLYSADGAPTRVVARGVAVGCLALSPDGKTAAIGGQDGSVVLHDLELGTRTELPGHTGPVSALAFSSDGALASGGEDGRLHLHPPARGGGSTHELGFVVGGLRFSPGGEWLFTWPGETRRQLATGDPLLLDARDGHVLARLTGHGARLDEAAFATRAPRLATACLDGVVRTFELPEARLLHAVAHPGKVLDVAFSPDDRHLATAFDPGAPGLGSLSGAWVLSAESGARELELRGHESRAVASVDWSADGTRLLTGSYDGTARVWSADGEQLSCLRLHDGLIFEARFIGSDERLLVRQTVRSLVVRAAELDPAFLVARHADPVLLAAFDASGTRLATGDAAGLVQVNDLARSTPLARFHAGPTAVRALAFVRDGAAVLSAAQDGVCRLNSVADGTAELVLALGEEPVEALVLDPGARTFWAACGSRVVQADLSGRIVRELGGGGARVTRLALSADGTRLASGGFDRTVRVWDASSGALLLELDDWVAENGLPSLSEVFDVAFDPTGERLVAATDDGMLHCYRLPGGESEWGLDIGPRTGRVEWIDAGRVLLTARWLGQTRLVADAQGPVKAPVAFLPRQAGLPTAQALNRDRTRALVSSTSGRTLIWDLEARDLWAAVGDGRSPVLSATFAPDGSAFVTTQADGTVLLRPLDVEEAARRALPEVVGVP